ncbi:TLD-domain-containing protein [Auriculariales sp. MPI-PUGE-AT-0066]|nr:TLD-domain-containing protein [Auriculariales sp. MPI-PUGE-AT-0066]
MRIEVITYLESTLIYFTRAMSRSTSPPAVYIPTARVTVPDTNLIDLSASTPEDDFGAFVSVPPSGTGTPNPPSQTRSTATSVLEAFDPLSAHTQQPQPGPSRTRSREPSSGSAQDFFSSATQRAQQNRANVLDELLAHEDDPMYWVDRSKSTNIVEDGLREGLHTPMFEQPQLGVQPAASTFEAHEELKPVEEGPVSPPPSPTLPARIPLPRSTSTSRPTSTRPSSSPERRRPRNDGRPPSVGPHTGASASPPPLATLSRKWMSSLLSSVPGAVAVANPEDQEPVTPSFAPGIQRQDSLAILSETIRHSPPAPRPSVLTSASTSHGTPFSYRPYVPPSGAPAFKGDRTWDKGFEYDAPPDESPVTLLGRTPATTAVLEPELAAKIRPNLPALTRLQSRWTLLYSLDQHGISLGTLYKRCGPPPGCEDLSRPTLLVVRDADDGLFGVFITEGIRLSGSQMTMGGVAAGIGGRRGFYGSGEAFLWRLTHGPPHPDETSLDTGSTPMDAVQVYRWTGQNSYVALCEHDSISFGGGDGHPGLWLDAALFDGSSAPCPTFGNDVLCGTPYPRSGSPPVRREGSGATSRVHTEKFECVGVEAWLIGDDA